jgi:hypothetical protein
MSLIFATQLSAVATLALTMLALATAWYARKAFRKQSEEVRVLLEQNERDIQERRMAQAVRIFLGSEPGTSGSLVHYARNASDFPVYSANIWYWESSGISPGNVAGHDPLGVIMPDKTLSGTAIPPGERKYAFLAFRDAQGVYWIRTPSGEVHEARHMSEEDDIRALATHRLIPLRNPRLAWQRPDNRRDKAGQLRARLRRAAAAVLPKPRAREGNG